MSFDRFFKVALLVVLLAFVVVYFLDTQQIAYGQGTTKQAGDIFRKLAAQQQKKKAALMKEVGRYQLAAVGGTLYALDTRTGQLYILRDEAMSVKEANQRIKWQKWYSFTDQKYGPKGVFKLPKRK